MNGHHHKEHHKREEGGGKYIAGIVISILVIIAAIGIGVWTITGGFGGPEEKTGQESGHASDLQIGTDSPAASAARKKRPGRRADMRPICRSVRMTEPV